MSKIKSINQQKIEILKQYRELIQELDLLTESYLFLRAKLMSPKIPILKPDKIQCSMTDITTENLAEMCDLEKAISERRKDILVARLKIEDMMEGIIRPDLRVLIRKKYVEGKRWEDIASELKYTWRWVHKLHSLALKFIKIS